METNAIEKLTAARTALLLDQPWFGSLAIQLKFEAQTDRPTISTDGTFIRYNADFVQKTSAAHLKAIIAHEVLHCALLHPYRRGNRDKQRWNAATDYAINAVLTASGFQLPPDVLSDPKYAGKSAEAIYGALTEDEQQQGGVKPESGQGQPDLSTGTCDDAPANTSKEEAKPEVPVMTEEDWKIAAEQATAVMARAGKDSGGASRAAKAARESREDWRAVLREFIEQQTPSDYTWATPNRRHIGSGLYLPGTKKENLGWLALIVDTSGSINARLLPTVRPPVQRLASCRMLAMFAAEVTAIVHEAQPDFLRVVYCDAKVHEEHIFVPDECALEIVLDAKGGGGTAFQPAFDYLANNDCEPPTAALYFTDLEPGDRPKDPGYPVLWVTGLRESRYKPDFGRVVRIDAWGDL